MKDIMKTNRTEGSVWGSTPPAWNEETGTIVLQGGLLSGESVPLYENKNSGLPDQKELTKAQSGIEVGTEHTSRLSNYCI